VRPQADSVRVGTEPGRPRLTADRRRPQLVPHRKAIAAAELPVPADPIPDPAADIAQLSTAAEQYEFIQQRLAAWYETDPTMAEDTDTVPRTQLAH
jgi:hypothetical protein